MERVLKREKSWLTNKRRYLERKNFSIYSSRVLPKICFFKLRDLDFNCITFFTRKST